MGDETATDAPDTETAEVEEVPRDERREALLADLTDVLGDGVVASHIEPGRDIWVRIASDAWGEAASAVRHRLGARYFGFVSAIDWMPSPFGRSMDSEVDNVLAAAAPADAADASNGSDSSDDEADASDAGEAADSGAEGGYERGITGGDTRFQLLARVAKVGDPEDFWGITLKADVPDESLTMPTWTAVYAGADWHERETWEMFGIEFAGHPGLRNIYLPTDFEGNPLRKDFPLLARMVKPWPGIVDVEPLPTDEDGDDS